MDILDGKMYYHVKIRQKSSKVTDELKLDLSEEKLLSQFIVPYENGENIFVNGKSIPPEDIERIKVNKTEMNSAELMPIIRTKRPKKAVAPQISTEWLVTKEGEDVTDDLIKGEPGYKKKKLGEKMEEVKPKSNQIFVVHGHDNEMKEAAARILERLGLEPIILHEQADRGATIFEKFEKHSKNVSFAVVLLSPDDKGYKKDQDPHSASYRARQNVILELGYFIGRLGRENVFALLRQEENFEFPSDIFGRLYTPYDSSGYWKNKLARELEAAGYDIDFGKL
ncbi:TIR domain-containing protein [Methanosarcina sp. DH2]|jgi:predicted nucleotide-binding protein|uniref:TIR domain-containing protein n=1 Tax=Methanosarcina sp. DH2 TaxID=2605639 RepID=UPI001E45260D|nr:TIR domain-containing protein [Methanosarcina sp. DH2]